MNGNQVNSKLPKEIKKSHYKNYFNIPKDSAILAGSAPSIGSQIRLTTGKTCCSK